MTFKGILWFLPMWLQRVLRFYILIREMTLHHINKTKTKCLDTIVDNCILFRVLTFSFFVYGVFWCISFGLAGGSTINVMQVRMVLWLLTQQKYDIEHLHIIDEYSLICTVTGYQLGLLPSIIMWTLSGNQGRGVSYFRRELGAFHIGHPQINCHFCNNPSSCHSFNPKCVSLFFKFRMCHVLAFRFSRQFFFKDIQYFEYYL